MATSAALDKFDPEEHKTNVYDKFTDFIDSFAYEYDAITKEPPKDLPDEAAKTAWIEKNKRKIFLGRFASRNLQRDFEEATTVAERTTITFTEMATKLKTRYEGNRNKTLANFEFHKLKQTEEESFDTYVLRIKHEASACDIKCTSATCTVQDTMVRDQIIIGTNNSEIRKNALKNQWNLTDLISNGRALEAATRGAQKIHPLEYQETPVARIKKPGKYSRKKPTPRNLEEGDSKCRNCSSRWCKQGSRCPALKRECFDCNKTGHFRGAEACRKKKSEVSKKKSHRILESDKESSSNTSPGSETEDSKTSSSDSEHEKRVHRTKFSKHITKIRRMRRKHIRRTHHKPRYEVEIILNEQRVKVFADTGADISVISRKMAKKLSLPLDKTKMKISPYGSKSVKCTGVYVGTVMYGEAVTNTCIYVVDQDLETLLSGKVSEELGIIEFNPKAALRTKIENTTKSKIALLYPNLFSGIGTLKKYQVKFHINRDVQPIAASARPVPFHLRHKFEKEIESMEKQGIIEEHHGQHPGFQMLC